MAEIAFLDAAIDDLRRLGPDVALKVLRRLVTLAAEPLAGRPLGGDLTGFRKLVVGRNTWRVVYRVVDDAMVVCEVWAVGCRAESEVYAEAAARARAAADATPALAPLADVVSGAARTGNAFVTASTFCFCSITTIPPTTSPFPSRSAMLRRWS